MKKVLSSYDVGVDFGSVGAGPRASRRRLGAFGHRAACLRLLRAVPMALALTGVGFVGACSGGANQGLGSDPDAGPGESKADASTTPSNVSSRAEQENDACPSSPENLRGTAGVGAACSTYSDCRPSCCGCDASSGSYLAAACVDGRCADKSDACYFGKSDSFCPGETGGSNDGHPPDGRDSGNDGQGDVGPGGGGTTICTDGYGSDCSGTNEKWTGTQCCVSNVTTCVDGYGSDCTGTGEHWTGKQCCVEASLCVDGYGSDCSGTGEHWTGKQCCVEASVCVDGYGSDCSGTGEHWTGKQCCLSGKNVICTDGYGSDCTGTGEHWTGKQCCVENVTQCVDGYSSSCQGAGEHWTGKQCCL